MSRSIISRYYDKNRNRKIIEEKGHRELIGGLWEEVGTLLSNFLISEGLERSSKIIDIGCGCLRVGIPLIDYLNPGNYYGTDISQDLLDIGYDTEIRHAGLQHKVARRQLILDSNFNFLLPNLNFQFALASSIFTHLPLNHTKLCLLRLAEILPSGGRFYATFFLVQESQKWDRAICQHPGNVTTFPTEDPYHYSLSDIRSIIQGLPWNIEIIEDWKHPRNQKMVLFTKQ